MYICIYIYIINFDIFTNIYCKYSLICVFDAKDEICENMCVKFIPFGILGTTPCLDDESFSRCRRLLRALRRRASTYVMMQGRKTSLEVLGLPLSRHEQDNIKNQELLFVDYFSFSHKDKILSNTIVAAPTTFKKETCRQEGTMFLSCLVSMVVLVFDSHNMQLQSPIMRIHVRLYICWFPSMDPHKINIALVLGAWNSQVLTRQVSTRLIP